MHKLPKALTFMGALLALTFCAVACKTDDDDEPTMYTVTVSDSLEHGKVTADKSSAEAGAKVKLTATAEEGYELDSYSVKDEKSNTIPVTDGTFTMPKSNVTVSATFAAVTYTVTVASDIVNGTVTANPTTAAAGSEITLTAEAASGYSFGSYSVTDADGNSVTVTDSKFTMPESNVTVTATFAAVTYTVTVASDIVNGTVTANPTTAAAGTEITLSVTPATGYQFATLTVTDAGGNAVTVTDSKFIMPKSNVTVTATFAALPPETAEYTVKHLQQNIADDNYTLKESETKTGTVGEETDVSAKSYDGFTAQTVTQVTIAASGTEVEIKYDRKTYTVTFDSNGGSDVSSQSLRYGATATKPADPSKNGFVFIGWYSDTGLESAFNFDTAITGDITLYAKWTPSGIYTENSAYYINVDSQSSPSDGNGSW